MASVANGVGSCFCSVNVANGVIELPDQLAQQARNAGLLSP